MNDVVISLTEQPQLDWAGRHEYLRAKFEKRRVDLYAMDLIWVTASMFSARYGGSFSQPQPSSIEYKSERKDSRTAKQITDGLLKKLKG